MPSCLPLRLGFRLLKGLRQSSVQRIVDARQQFGQFSSIEQFHGVTALPRSVMKQLAQADAFASLHLSRRQALWQVMALDDQQLPLFPSPPSCLRASVPSCLPPMPLGQEVMIDYRTAGLSLKKHPVALVREQLDELGIIPANQLLETKHGQWVQVAGLVLIRQRPGTAAGVVFVTLEDETGIANLIIRPHIYEKYRLAARHAALLHAQGYVQRQDKVIHVMVWKLTDRSELLVDCQFKSRDFH